MVVIQLEGGDAGGIGLEAQNHNVTHQSHVLGNVLRNAVFGAFCRWLVSDGFLALQLAALAGTADAALDLTHAFEVFIELALIA